MAAWGAADSCESGSRRLGQRSGPGGGGPGLGGGSGGGVGGELFSTAGVLDSLKAGRGRLMAQASLGEGGLGGRADRSCLFAGRESKPSRRAG